MKTIEIEIPDSYKFDKGTMSVVKDENTHEVICTYIDLGLPSGTLWADRNVGADKPEDYGDYFTFEEAKYKAPTYNQLIELFDNTNIIWCKIQNVHGNQFVSKINGNYIFLPAAGFRYKEHLYREVTKRLLLVIYT